MRSLCWIVVKLLSVARRLSYFNVMAYTGAYMTFKTACSWQPEPHNGRLEGNRSPPNDNIILIALLLRDVETLSNSIQRYITSLLIKESYIYTDMKHARACVCVKSKTFKGDIVMLITNQTIHRIKETCHA